MKALVLAALASAAVVACGVPRKTCTTLVPEPAYGKDTVQISFLGVGGVIVRWQGRAIMTAPLYSNPTLGELALSEIHPDPQRIDELMRDGLHDVTGVRAILAGHSHYDHLMDVPYIALHRARQAQVLGNDAMVKLLHPIENGLSTKPISLQKLGLNGYYDVPETRFRIRPVISQHSPQIGPRLEGKVARVLAWLFPLPEVSLWRGEDEYPAEELPSRAGNWTGGTALAFVIELLQPGNDDVAFRIYYQDSPTERPYGYPEPASETHRYDLAILCLGGATEYTRFPADIVGYLTPRFVMGIHWEDFFHPRKLPAPGEIGRKGERIRYLAGVDEKRFLKAVRAAQKPGGRAIVPCPDMTTVFTRTSGSWQVSAGGADWSTPKP